jgi:hypothetical protein
MVFTGDFTMTVGANPNAANAETPVIVARSIETEQMGKPVGGSRRTRSSPRIENIIQTTTFVL